MVKATIIKCSLIMHMKLVELAKECPGLQVMITVGTINRYRMSDIHRIIEGGDSNHTFLLLNYCYGQASTEFL